MSDEPTKTPLPPEKPLGDMIDEPVEVHVEPHGNAEVGIDAKGADPDDLDIEIHAGQHADVTVNIENTASKDQAIKGDDRGLVVPRWVRVALNPFMVLALMLVPVAAWFFMYDRSPVMFMGLMIASVVGWLVLMVALYEWARSYYKYISKSVGKAEGVEIVSSVAGGLSEAFPAAIIALGIGGTAAYLENRYHERELVLTEENHAHEMAVAAQMHQNQVALENKQWQREQAQALLQALNSEGYATIYIAKSMMERLTWLQIMDAVGEDQINENGFKLDKDGNKLVCGVTQLSYLQVAGEYDAMSKEYAEGSNLESILHAVMVHFEAEIAPSAKHEQLRSDILSDSEAALGSLDRIWEYPWLELETLDGKQPVECELNDKRLFKELYRMSNKCEQQIAAVSRNIRQYVSLEPPDATK